LKAHLLIAQEQPSLHQNVGHADDLEDQNGAEQHLRRHPPEDLQHRLQSKEWRKGERADPLPQHDPDDASETGELEDRLQQFDKRFEREKVLETGDGIELGQLRHEGSIAKMRPGVAITVNRIEAAVAIPKSGRLARISTSKLVVASRQAVGVKSPATSAPA
jgi:hypothetical protein